MKMPIQSISQDLHGTHGRRVTVCYLTSEGKQNTVELTWNRNDESKPFGPAKIRIDRHGGDEETMENLAEAIKAAIERGREIVANGGLLHTGPHPLDERT